ncbi:MAG: N-acetylglucosamine-specific PTS transporter subunit IIBC [Woeseiaceae bacterium]
MARVFPALQKLGRSLMLPIAVLPIAGLLLRLGQPDLLDLAYVAAAGNAVFANLGLLFAIGVAVGLARNGNGAAGVAAVVAYLVATEGARVLIQVPPGVVADAVDAMVPLLEQQFRDAAIAKLSVPAGLVCGIVAGNLYNRFSEIRLPDYLAFFAGRRFVPIISGFAALAIAAVFGFGWPVLEHAMNTMSEAVVGAGELGLFAYGFLNRLLIITGLHHILNNLAWFIVGDYQGVTGDLRRFFAGDPAAGAFMSGFFPVMMFGLPAACLAMYRCAAKGRRKVVGGLFASMALTSFLTGITEPIEFTFMFIAPALYALHALLTGLAMALMDLLDVRLGFGFSAGLFDYILNFDRATSPLLVLPVGLAYALIYYTAFHFCIVRFNLPTPGREAAPDAPASALRSGDEDGDAAAFIRALGGPSNLVDIDACTTRLRLQIADQSAVDESMLKSLGAAGVLRPTAETLQVVVGTRADEIASRIRKSVDRTAKVRREDRPGTSPVVAETAAEMPFAAASELIAALGGAANIAGMECFGSRLSILLQDSNLVDDERALQTGVRGVARLPDHRIHVLASSDAAGIERAVREQLQAG